MTPNARTKPSANAAESAVPDVLAPGLRLVFCGTAPSRASAAARAYYAKPGNRFWPVLHAAGFTPSRFHPSEYAALLGLGIGADGLKTGHTAEAGYGLVGSAKQGDRRIVFVITGLPSMAARAISGTGALLSCFVSGSGRVAPLRADIANKAPQSRRTPQRIGRLKA